MAIVKFVDEGELGQHILEILKAKIQAHLVKSEILP